LNLNGKILVNAGSLEEIMKIHENLSFKFSDHVPEPHRILVRSMLEIDPVKRPSFKKILENEIFEGYLDKQ